MKAILRQHNDDSCVIEVITERPGSKIGKKSFVVWAMLHEDFLCTGDEESEKIKHDISENGFADIEIKLSVQKRDN